MVFELIWFILIVVLFTGFFALEGFDYGVGILHPFVAKTDQERRMSLNSLAPFWDANEVWMITAGGAMFAAFPQWYATLFSGFYLALFLMLVALIMRGVAFEFRSKVDDPRWRRFWDWSVFGGSAVPALLWGVALGNIMRGVAIDETMTYVGTFWDLLNPYALVGGLTTLAIFALQGALFLDLKTEGKVRERARAMSQWLGAAATALGFLFVVLTYLVTDFYESGLGINPGLIPILAGAALLSIRFLISANKPGWAFTMGTATIAFSTLTVFIGLYPKVLPSSLNDAWSLTVENASSSPYTLKVMFIVALIFTPIALVYQAWNYWVFRERVKPEHLKY